MYMLLCIIKSYAFFFQTDNEFEGSRELTVEHSFESGKIHHLIVNRHLQVYFLMPVLVFDETPTFKYLFS